MPTPEQGAAARPPFHPRAAKVPSRKPLTVRGAEWIIACVTVSVTIVAGILIHFTDRDTFPNLGGLWWAMQTVTTVGYGDLVPTSPIGRLAAAVVMLAGIGFLTVLTATINSTFIADARRPAEATSADAISVKLDEIGVRLGKIEARLDDRLIARLYQLTIPRTIARTPKAAPTMSPSLPPRRYSQSLKRLTVAAVHSGLVA